MNRKLKVSTKYAVFVLAAVVFPLLIHLLAPDISSEISADGLLSYFSALGTVFLALVTIDIQRKIMMVSETANEISKRSLELQENEDRPVLSFCEISEGESVEIYKVKRLDIDIKTEDDLFVAHDRELPTEDDEDFISGFLKNVQKHDIIDVAVKKVSISIRDEDTGDELKKYPCKPRFSIMNHCIEPSERIFLVLALPDNIWVDNASYEEKGIVHIEMVLLLSNYQGVQYKETIIFDTINAVQPGMSSFMISNYQLAISKCK